MYAQILIVIPHDINDKAITRHLMTQWGKELSAKCGSNAVIQYREADVPESEIARQLARLPVE